MQTSDVILKHFDTLVEQGLKPIPLKVNSKQPYNKGWNKNWNYENSRWYFRCEPTLNMGLLLGDIIDVEGDTLEANDKITKLIGDYPHPCYRSRKSIHHLFLTPDPELTRIQVKGVEFRGYGHQSVLPPSQHQGVFYRWKEDSIWPVPQMPDSLLEYYWHLRNGRKRRSTTVKPGHIKVWCNNCKQESFMHQKRFDSELELFQMMCQKWTCQKCRKIDLRPLVRRLRRKTLILPILKRKFG